MADPELPGDLQRWTAKRRAALVLSILKRDTTPQEAVRKHGLPAAEVESSRDKFLSGAENAVSSQVPTPTIRSGKGLVFKSKHFRVACRGYRLAQEFVTPYTPEQDGLVERFFRSLKEECAWQENFPDFQAANCAITRWSRSVHRCAGGDPRTADDPPARRAIHGSAGVSVLLGDDRASDDRPGQRRQHPPRAEHWRLGGL
jgi:transposase InsO family protein